MPSLFRQEPIAVNQRVEIARDVAKMDADHAVVLLAETTAPLPLDTGGLVALFVKARLVDHPNAVRMGMVTGYPTLHPVAGGPVVRGPSS